jgi:dihydrodipicolinate synthase/N-acetylneuraminate lyase
MQTDLSERVSERRDTVASQRAALLKRFFPEEPPVLWCPSLAHYDASGKIDARRIAAHLAHLSPHVKGFLIPGSTSDGWELSEAEFWELLEIALEQTDRLKLHLLIGVLRTDASAALALTKQVIEHIQRRTGDTDPQEALLKAGVCGVAVCAPRGEKVSQAEMDRAFSSVLDLGLPTAVYQIPQITKNEIGPELIFELSQRYRNFILFKDSSGGDRAVTSGRNLCGVFTMRGAEGDYARWFKAAGGPYGGFLLSTANCFAAELHEMIDDLSSGKVKEAESLSNRVTNALKDVFALLQSFPDGLIYANANKAIDHFFAHGPEAAKVPPPRIHAGSSLPVETIRKTGEVLQKYGLMPKSGYLK